MLNSFTSAQVKCGKKKVAKKPLKVFSGSTLVDWLATNLFLKRSAATSVGQWLVAQQLIESASSKGKNLFDAPDMFRWLPKADDPTSFPARMNVTADAFAQVCFQPSLCCAVVFIFIFRVLHCC